MSKPWMNKTWDWEPPVIAAAAAAAMLVGSLAVLAFLTVPLSDQCAPRECCPCCSVQTETEGED